MKRLLLPLLLLFVSIAFAQKRPTVYKAYLNNTNRFIIDNLILSSDGLFFFFTSCECGKEYYGKGKWQIKGKKLYLRSFDSTKTFPNATVDKISVDSPTDSVTIKAYDYFGKPMKSFMVELIYRSSSNFQSMPQFFDKTGKLTIAKKDYSGFFLIYEARDETGFLKKNEYSYSFDKDTKEIIIQIDFAAAGFDREPIPLNYGNKTFIITDRKLLGKNGKTAFVEISYDD
jgi:hypothetical protein